MSLITPGEAAAPTARQDDSRKQLGAFLRARRESLDPQRLGLPRSGRRRTPGLRREEVAMLADVGVTWYTWLEQGREVNPSVAVMQAIAEALQCSELETRHLFVLAGLKPLESAYVPLWYQSRRAPHARQFAAAAGQYSACEFRHCGVERRVLSADGRRFFDHS